MGEYSNLFVCFMGIGTVFVGLICIILLTKMMGFLCNVRGTPAPAIPTPAAPTAAVPAGDHQAMIAAVSAALAEELGTDITGIRILSIRKCS